MAAISGRLGELWVGTGAGTLMTAQACELVSGTTYHVTLASRRYFAPATTPLVYDNAVLQTTGYHIDGGCQIRFDSAPTTPITVTANYLTPTEVTLVQNWELNLESEAYKTTSLGDTSQRYIGSGLIGWSGSFERFYEDNTWAAFAAANATQFLIRLFEDQPAGWCWTGWITPTNWGQTVPMELEKETFGWTGELRPAYTTDET